MKIFGYTIPEIKKFLVAGAGTAVLIANELLKMNDILPPQVSSWATVVVSLGMAFGVFGVPNLKPDEAPEGVPDPADAETPEAVPAKKRRRIRVV